MIEWLRRVDPGRPFLYAGDRTWTYGEAVAAVQLRLESGLVSTRALDPDSVFSIIADIGDGHLVVNTSGTTGEPKPVHLTLANLEAAAAASAQHLGHGRDDNWLLAMPLSHVGGISIVVRQSYTGGSVTLLDGFDPGTFSTAMKGGVTMVSVVPTMLRRLLPLGPYSGLRAVLVGGGPIPGGLLEEARDVGIPAVPTYGMTETFGQVATLRPQEPLAYAVEALPGIEISIEADGRVAVRGDQVAEEVVDADGWFVTNDLGELDSDGKLRVLGRADYVIVTGGMNVNPERVESALQTHHGLLDLAVVGLPDPEWGQAVTCFYAGDVEETELRQLAVESLPSFMVPKRWVRLDAIPKTSIGKPDRATLTASDLGGRG